MSMNLFGSRSKSYSTKRSKSEYRSAMFSFVSGLLSWAAYAKKQQNPHKPTQTNK